MRTTVVETSCDFCGHGGPFTRPEDFKHFDSGVDLCHWCARTGGPGVMECGPHRIEITADTWTCSCGEAYSRPLFISPRVMDAVPDVVHATARIHSESLVSS